MGENQFNYPGRGRDRGQYILEGHRPVPCDDLVKWGQWIEDASRSGEKIVKSDMVKGVHISTIFLGLDYSFGYGPPLLFETMIFRGPMDMYQRRYYSWEGALHGHNQALKACIKALNHAGRKRMLRACSKESLPTVKMDLVFKHLSPKSRIKTYATSIF